MSRPPEGGARWQRVKALLDRALQEPVEERAELLDELCEGDETLRDELDSLLRHGEADSFLELRVAASAFETSDGVGRDGPGERRQWGHLEIIESVGSGAFGEVFRCRDPSLDMVVALKLFRATGSPSDSMPAELARRTLQEGQLLARIRHPNVLRVHGAGVHDETVGIWTEFIEGRNLEEVLQQQGRLGDREASLVGIDLCGALAAVHGEGVVHRDIKAQNVIREDGGRIILSDFGSGHDVVGEETWQKQAVAGTPLYMAPEVLQGAPATPRSDIYSLGVLLFRLVTGRFPVEADSWSGLIAAHDERAVLLRDARPDISPRFARVIETAIATDPGDRFASAGEMQRALEAAADLTSPAWAPAPTDGGGSATGLEQERDSIRRMARVLTGVGLGAGGIALLSLLGWLTSMVKRVAFSIPESFAGESFVQLVGIGANALFPVIVFAVVAAGLGGIGTVLLRSVRGRWGAGPRSRHDGAAGEVTGTPAGEWAAVALGTVVLLGIIFVFRDLLGAIMALQSPVASRAADLGILHERNALWHQLYPAPFAVVALLMLTALLRSLRRGSGSSPAGRVCLASLAVFALAFAVMPWRLLWRSDHEVVDWENRRAFVIASNETQLWLYTPHDHARFAVETTDERLERPGRVAYIFGQATTPESGSEDASLSATIEGTAA